MDFVGKLIAYGYFFKEMPPEFHSESLAKVLDKINFDSFSKPEKNIWTKPVQYSVPKKDNFRRLKTIPAPIHQIQLCKLINENWVHLENHFSDSKISMSIPELSSNDKKATVTKIPISEKMHIRMNHLHNKNYILQTDISRYFNTIYTHVIPWALHTKEFAKAKIGKPILGNKIDKILQNMQDGQTFGIPMGPETSQIISEIIGVAIDRDFKNQMCSDVPGFRFTDDIEYYFDNEDTAKKALVKLQKIVNEYQLELNPSKTRILKAPIEFESEWQQFFTRFKFRSTIYGQRSDINSFFSNAFKYKSTTEDKGILSYALKVIRKEIIHKDNWSIFESLLLHSGFSDATCLPLVLEIIEGYHIKGYELNLNKLKEFIEELIENNILHNNHYEVVWALVFSKRLNIKLKTELNSLLSQSDNSIICILTMLLKSKGLLEGFFDTQKYKSYLNVDELYGSQWLFAYEAYKQGWLKPYSDPEYVIKDKFFKILYENDVSFLRSELDLFKLKEELLGKNILLSNPIEQNENPSDVPSNEAETDKSSEESSKVETDVSAEAQEVEEKDSSSTEEPNEVEANAPTEVQELEEEDSSSTVELNEVETDTPTEVQEVEEEDSSLTEELNEVEIDTPTEAQELEEEDSSSTEEPNEVEANAPTEAQEEEDSSSTGGLNEVETNAPTEVQEVEEEDSSSTEEPNEVETETRLEELEDDIFASINEMFEDSIYQDNEWLITLLNTDLENSDKIDYSKIEKDY